MHEQSAAEMPSDEGGHALQSKASPAWGVGPTELHGYFADRT